MLIVAWQQASVKQSREKGDVEYKGSTGYVLVTVLLVVPNQQVALFVMVWLCLESFGMSQLAGSTPCM